MPDDMKKHQKAIWAALCEHSEYLIKKACEDDMFDETRLNYLADLKACRDAQKALIVNWED